MNREIRFLFFIEREFHIVLLLPLINYIKTNNSGELALYNLSPQQSEEQISNYGLRTDILNKYLAFEIKQITDPYAYQPDITFMADFSYHYVEGLGKIVNIGHGTISKGWYYSKSSISSRENCADLICVPGDIHKEQLSDQVFSPILVSGMPKLDKLFSNQYNKADLIHKMHLNPNNKTVLLAPTFNDEFSLLPYLTESIRNYIPAYLNLIIKLHGVASENIKKALRNSTSGSENIYFCEDYDISECFAVADVLISDLSSVIYEFLACYKPVILFDSPKQKEYINYNENDIEYLYRNIGSRFTDPKQIPELLFRTLTGAELSPEIKLIADKFITIKDGSSSTLIVNKAMSLLSKKKNKETHIVIIDENSKVTSNIIKKFNDRFNISIISEQDYPEIKCYQAESKSYFNLLKKIALTVDEKYLLILNSSYDLSPQLPCFMNTHLVQNDQDVYVPLILNDEINFQQAKLRVQTKENFDNYLMGVQLTYSFAGQSIEIPYAEALCFGINKTYLSQIDFDADNAEFNWFSLLTALKEQKAGIKLAFDCMISKPITPKQTKKSQITDNYPNISNLLITEEELKHKLMNDPSEENILELIKYYYKKKMWEQLDVYGEMLSDNYQAQWYLIRSLEEQKLIERAYELLSKTAIVHIKSDIWRAKWYALKGKLQLKLNKTNEALINIENALIDNQEDIDALLAKAAYYLIKNELTKSFENYNLVLGLEPENRSALIGAGLIHQLSGQFHEAEEKFSYVLSKNEEDIDAITGIVKCAWQTNSFEKAEKYLLGYLSIHPANLDMLFTLSGIYFELKRYQEALSNLETIFLFKEDYQGAKELYNRIKQNF